MRTIYFDYNSTTPLDPRVQEAMQPFWESEFGNPSSIHHVGRRARAALDEARDQVAGVWRCKPSEVLFTGGGTESNNLAILGTARRLHSRGRHLITSPTEHSSVLACFEHLARHEGFVLSLLPVDTLGFVDPSALRQTLRPDTILVSVMAANNETGTLQPVAELGSICRERGVLFHTDAAQSFGKVPFESIHQFNADLVTFCAHKLHGPKGVGALFIHRGAVPHSIQYGGSQENERRAGTENVGACIGLAKAAFLFLTNPPLGSPSVHALRERLLELAAAVENVTPRSPRQKCLSNTAAFTIAGCDSLSLLAALDLEGICASSGSACSSGSLRPSHVLLAMGVGPEEAGSLVRFSLGRESSAAEVERLGVVLPGIVDRIRSLR